MTDLRLAPSVAAKYAAIVRTRMLGGPGSGNFGYGGRPGEVGGSSSDSATDNPMAGEQPGLHTPEAQKRVIAFLEKQTGEKFKPFGSLSKGKTSSNDMDIAIPDPTFGMTEVEKEAYEEAQSILANQSQDELMDRIQRGIATPEELEPERPAYFKALESIGFKHDTDMAWGGILVARFHNEKTQHTIEIWQGDPNASQDRYMASAVEAIRLWRRAAPRTLAKKTYTVHTVADTFAPALKKAIISSFNPSSVKDEEAASAFLESWEARVREAMIPVLHRVLVTSGTLHGLKMRVSEGFRSAKQPPIKSKIGKLGLKFDVANPKAIKWARERAAELAVDMVETTKKSVRSIIARGFTEGRHPYQTAKLLVEVIGLTERQGEALMAYRDTLEEQGYSERDIDDEVSSRSNEMFEARAETIARTETMRASNEGQQELWEQAADEGLLTGFELREWIVTPDDRLCAVCEAMEGQTAAMGEPFDVDGEDVMVPPAHPNCRCTIGISAESPGPENLEARTLGGPGSGNFGHSGRPGEVGGSGEGDSNEATSASRGFGRVRADLEEQTKWTESRPQLTEAIVRYTGDDYKAINSSLREGNPNADAQEIVKGLEEVPPLERPVVVFRGLKGSPGGTGEKIAAMTPGTEIILNGLQSASTNPLNALKFGKTLLRIEATKGIFIKGKSLIKSENEFLMNHGHRFVVKSNADQGDGVKIITLRQVA